MKARSRRKRVKKRKRWLRRLYWALSGTLLIVMIAFSVVLANLKRIVVGRLRAGFPGLRVSVADVSLKSFSHLRISGLRLSDAKGESGSSVMMPKVDVRFRVHPLRVLILKSVDLPGLKANLRPGVGGVLASVTAPAREGERAEHLPVGPAIGKVTLTDSSLDFAAPGFHFRCSLEAVADSSSSGTLLEDTYFSLQLQDFFLKLPFLRLRDVDPQLSTLIVREPTGKRIDVLHGVFSIPDILQSDFHGELSLEESALTAEGEMDVQSFRVSDVLVHLKESFPELDRYRIEGEATARVQVHYRSGAREPLSFFGDVSLTGGEAILPVPKRLIVEQVAGHVPFRCSLLDEKMTLIVGSEEGQHTNATVAATRIAYDEQELASDLDASFELHADTAGNLIVSSADASFRSHGGNVNARLTGSLRKDGLDLEGDLSAQDIALEEVFRRLGIPKYNVWGRASGKARLACTASAKGAVSLKGESSFRVPEAVVSLQKPLNVRGLEVRTPFEYSAPSKVQPFRIERSERHPLGGTIIAQRIGYGEKVAEDGTSTPEWTVSDLWANVVCTGDTAELSIKSCRAYDGEVTGVISASLEGKAPTYRGKLDVFDLNLERLARALGARKEKFDINGLAEGGMEVSGKEGAWDARLSFRVPEVTVSMQKLTDRGELRVREPELERLVKALRAKEEKFSAEGMVEGEATVSGKEGEWDGELSLRVPKAVVSLQKPLTVEGLEVAAPIEYSSGSNVESFGIKPSGNHPWGGRITAETITYGEKAAEDVESASPLSVSDFLANLVVSGATAHLFIESCRLYDGEVTGGISASWGKKGFGYGGEGLRARENLMQGVGKDPGAEKHKVKISGLMEGEVTVSGTGGEDDAVHGNFFATPPGGTIKIEDVEELIDSLSGEVSEAALQARKRAFTAQQWEKFREAVKDFRYRELAIEITYYPLKPRLASGVRVQGNIRLVGTGEGYTFDLTIPIAWQRGIIIKGPESPEEMPRHLRGKSPE